MKPSNLRRRIDLYKELEQVVDKGKNEEIKPSCVLKKGNNLYCVDFFLPQGCTALKMPNRTVIEVKSSTLFDTVYRQKKRYEELRGRKDGINCYILALEELNEYAPKPVRPTSKTGFGVVTIGGLMNDIKASVQGLKAHE